MKVVKWERAKRFALILGLSGLLSEVAAQQGYAIQAGAYRTAGEAEEAAARLSLTCSPVATRAVQDGSGYPYKVRVGRFVTYAEAWANKCLLNSPELEGAFIVAGVEGSGAVQNVLPLRTQWDSFGLEEPDPAEGRQYWEAAGLTGSDALNGGKETPQELEDSLQKGIASQPNRVRLRLVRKYARTGNAARVSELLNQVRWSGNGPEVAMADFVEAHASLHLKNRAGALEKFTRLANNRNLPPSLRRECLRRAAGIYHAQQNYPEAWKAFELLSEVSTTPAERQEARMQLAGLAFELVKRGKGNWEEVRALCQVVTDDPETPRKVRATAELMKRETLWEEQRFEDALQGMEQYLASFGDIPREAQTARLWRGIILFKLKRLDEARGAFEQVAALAPGTGPEDKFAGVEPRELSAAWLALIADRQGNQSSRDHWMRVLQTEFPQSRETRELPALFTR